MYKRQPQTNYSMMKSIRYGFALRNHTTVEVCENRVRYRGKEMDEEIGLYYLGARYYDADIGMWISPDPMRQFASPYLYAGNGYNPVNTVDPDGKAQIYSRPLAGVMSSMYSVNSNFRHDYIVFDQTQSLQNISASTWGLYGDNGMFGSKSVFRPDQMPLSVAWPAGNNWVPDRFVAKAINDLMPLFPTYDVRDQATNCQGFAEMVMWDANKLFMDEIDYAAEHNPLIVNLLSDD